MSEIVAWRDCRRPNEREREREENTGIRAGYESGFCWLSREICELVTEARAMALAELGSKNNATVTKASDH